MRDTDMTVADFLEAQALGDVDGFAKERQKENAITQAQKDVLTSEFGKALEVTLQATLDEYPSELLWEILAMNFHRRCDVWSHDEWISAVKEQLDNGDFRKKQRARYENKWSDAERIKQMYHDINKAYEELIKRGVFYSATKDR